MVDNMEHQRAIPGPRAATRSYLLFLDECGTHDMRRIDSNFPVFVLLGLLVGERYYAKTLVPSLKKFKRIYLPDPSSILHSYKIRKCTGDFLFLKESESTKQKFYDGLNALFLKFRMRLFSVVIDKRRLLSRFIVPLNPYDVSLSLLLSLVLGPTGIPSDWRPTVTRFIAESRGKREDKELQAEYQQLRRSGLWNYRSLDLPNRKASTVQKNLPDRMEFVRKNKGVLGLELADLAAYPIARASVNQQWDNEAYRIVAQKLRGIVHFP
jgi:hypothetical protein